MSAEDALRFLLQGPESYITLDLGRRGLELSTSLEPLTPA